MKHLAIILILLAPALAFAQAPAKDAPTIKLTPQGKGLPANHNLWGASDAIFIGAALADIASTQRALKNCVGCYEAGAIKSNVWRGVAYASIETGLKLYEWRYPDSRKAVRILRWIGAGMVTMAVVNNARRGR